MDDKVKIIKLVIEENLYYDKTVLLNYRIEYPQFFLPKYQKNLNIINLYYKNKAYELQRTCFKALFAEAIDFYEYSKARGYPIRKFEILQTFNVTYNQECTLSLYLDQFNYMGGAHGITVRTSDTWNIQNGERILLCDLFKNELEYYKYVSNIINEQITSHIKLNEHYTYFEDFENKVSAFLNCNNFYLTSLGIIIYFQHYEIAPYSMGIPEYLISYNDSIMNLPKCT